MPLRSLAPIAASIAVSAACSPRESTPPIVAMEVHPAGSARAVVAEPVGTFPKAVYSTGTGTLTIVARGQELPCRIAISRTRTGSILEERFVQLHERVVECVEYTRILRIDGTTLEVSGDNGLTGSGTMRDDRHWSWEATRDGGTRIRSTVEPSHILVEGFHDDVASYRSDIALTEVSQEDWERARRQLLDECEKVADDNRSKPSP